MDQSFKEKVHFLKIILLKFVFKMKLLLLFVAVVYFLSAVQAKPQELINTNVQPTVKETFNENTKVDVNENVNENLKENITEILDENQGKDLLKHFSYHNGYFSHNSNNDNDKNEWHNAYKVFHLSYPLKVYI